MGMCGCWGNERAISALWLFSEPRVVAWKDRLQGIVLPFGLAVAICLEHWCDRNVRDQIDNARQDIDLKEFQKV